MLGTFVEIGALHAAPSLALQLITDEEAARPNEMLTRGGLKVNGIEVFPYNVYSKAATDGSYGAFVFSLGASTPDSAPCVQAARASGRRALARQKL